MNDIEIEKFITVWMDALKNNKTGEDIYEQLGYKNKSQLANRASYLRKLGFKLPRLNIGVMERKQRVKRANKLLVQLTSLL